MPRKLGMKRLSSYFSVTPAAKRTEISLSDEEEVTSDSVDGGENPHVTE